MYVCIFVLWFSLACLIIYIVIYLSYPQQDIRYIAPPRGQTGLSLRVFNLSYWRFEALDEELATSAAASLPPLLFLNFPVLEVR